MEVHSKSHVIMSRIPCDDDQREAVVTDTVLIDAVSIPRGSKVSRSRSLVGAAECRKGVRPYYQSMSMLPESTIVGTRPENDMA
jgi:hypothetical protein